MTLAAFIISNAEIMLNLRFVQDYFCIKYKATIVEGRGEKCVFTTSEQQHNIGIDDDNDYPILRHRFIQ